MTTLTTSTTGCPPAIALHRPWWQRLADRLRRPPARRADDDAYAALGHLSESTLRDIGAPDWVHERDRARLLRELERGRW